MLSSAPHAEAVDDLTQIHGIEITLFCGGHFPLLIGIGIHINLGSVIPELQIGGVNPQPQVVIGGIAIQTGGRLLKRNRCSMATRAFNSRSAGSTARSAGTSTRERL